jgi:drug/metabolite transporter (DMT)-like permease
MAQAEQVRPITDLLGGLASDISGLFRKEIQLAKTEASEKLDEVMSASSLLAIGGILALGALGVLLAAAVTALAAAFVAAGMDPTLANSLAALLVAAVVGGIAWALISRGLTALQASKLQLTRTTHSLAQDARAVKEQF